MHVSRIFIERPIMTALVTFAILLFGIVGYRALPVAALPSVDYPTLQITSVLPGANLSGHFNSFLIGGSFETGYNLQFRSLEVTPFAGTEFGSLLSGSYTEAGSNLMGLSYAGRTVVSLPTFLGLQFGSQVKLGRHTKLSGRIRGAWKHELEPDRSVDGSFIAAPGFNFVVQGAQLPIEVFRSSAAAILTFHEKVEVFAKFDGDFSRFSPVYAGWAGVRVTF